MKKLAAVLLIITAACAPANDDTGEAAAADSAAVPAPTPVAANGTPDTLAKSNGPAIAPESQSDHPTASAQSQPRGASRVSGQEHVRGIVRLTGTVMEQITTVETSQGAVVVRGALERDVRSLSGAVVVLHGKVSDGPPRSIEVEAYSVAEIEGQPATVGTVTSDGRALVVGSDTVTLLPPPAGLQPGARIWVTGPRTGNTVRVASFGVIRPPQ